MQHFTAREYLKIDIANSFGLDKDDWSVRLTWFDQNEQAMRAAPFDWMQRAEEPAQFLAGLNAWEKACLGQKTGYLCGLDATASGIQLLSVLSGCVQSAQQCNVVNTGKREDAYTNMHVHMDGLLNHSNQYTRKAVKAAGMTHFYGSKAEPRAAFGEDTPQLAAFYKTIETLLPGADMLNHDLLSLWQPTALSHDWTLPDGFDVKIKVMVSQEHAVTFLDRAYTVTTYVNQAKESGLSMGANIVHSIDGMVVREMGRRCNFDATKLTDMHLMLHTETGGKSTLRQQDLELLRLLECTDASGFMSLVIAEYLDESNLGHLSPAHRQQLIQLIESLPPKPFHLIAIHDCFKFHANYGNDVREQYINIMAELADSDILSHIATQVTGKHMPVNKRSNNLSSYIRQSEYMLS